jgi:epoxyqueuosine reductase QueG
MDDSDGLRDRVGSQLAIIGVVSERVGAQLAGIGNVEKCTALILFKHTKYRILSK